MELTPIFKRVIGLDVHQAQITACAIMEQAEGTVVIDERQFGGFKRDRNALAFGVRVPLRALRVYAALFMQNCLRWSGRVAVGAPPSAIPRRVIASA